MSEENENDARILVVDDESSLRLAFRYTLRGRGHRVDECATGQAALEQLARHDYDLVILDQQMPDLKGTEVLQRIRERGLETPVIMVSAFGSSRVVDAARKLDCAAFLHKPVTPQELRSAVSTAIQSGA